MFHFHSSELIRYKLCTLIAIGLFFYCTYTLAGIFYCGKPHLMPKIWIDNNTPLLNWTFWIYSSDYLFLVLGGLLMPDKKSVRKIRNAYIATLFFHFGIFVIYPTYMIRPEIVGDSWGAAIGRWTQLVDNPTNCFPSLHVSSTFVVSFIICYYYKFLCIPMNLWALAISVSTLTTKQHYFYDVVSGFIVSIVVFIIFCLYNKREKQDES